MAVAAPNQTRLKILASVLELESFTVAELCLHAGLERSMVYRELSNLQQNGTLTSGSAVAKGEAGPRHCPPKRYELTTDSGKRDELESELESFLPDFEEAQSNRHLKKAQEVLNLVSVDLLASKLRSLADTELNRWERGLKGRLAEAQKELDRATWESETDFSEEEASDHPILLATRLYESLDARFKEQVGEERSRRESEAARKVWGGILTSALRAAIPAAKAARAAKAYSVYFDLANFEKVSDSLSEKIKEMASEEESRSKRANVCLPFFSSFELDVREAESESEFLAILAKHGIAYGISAEEPLAYVRGLVCKSRSRDYRLLFDQANLAQLAEQPEEAYNSWVEYLGKKPKPDTEGVEPPVVARVLAKHWSADAYRQVVQKITGQCQASVSALSQTPFEGNAGYRTECKLYNPNRDKSEQQTPLIAIADYLLQDKRLYVVTTEAEEPVVLGLPSFACAGWFRSRVNNKRAWELAGTVEPSERIVKVEFFRGATPETRREVERVLTDSMCAELVG